jgi:hypothetical protein
MFGQGPRAIAVLTAILIALQLSACGGDSSATEAADTESVAEARDEVNEDLRGDIVSFGQAGSEAELESATVVLRAYLNARASERYSDACAYLSKYMLAVAKTTARRRGEGGCAAGVESLARVSAKDDDTKGPPRIEPSVIRRGNQRTFVIYEGDGGGTYAMLMQRKGATWKIQGFEPTRIR